MASRMESTGEPEKIQISEASKTLLANEYPEFVTVKRGDFDIKVEVLVSRRWIGYNINNSGKRTMLHVLASAQGSFLFHRLSMRKCVYSVYFPFGIPF